MKKNLLYLEAKYIQLFALGLPTTQKKNVVNTNALEHFFFQKDLFAVQRIIIESLRRLCLGQQLIGNETIHTKQSASFIPQ